MPMLYFFGSLVACVLCSCPGLVCIFGYVQSKTFKGSIIKLTEPTPAEPQEGEPEPPPAVPRRLIQDRVPSLFDELVVPTPCEEPRPPTPPFPTPKAEELRFVLSSRLAFSGPHLELSILGRRLEDHPMPPKIRYAIGATASSRAATPNPYDAKGIILASRVRRPDSHRPQWGMYDHENDALRPRQLLGPTLIRSRPATQPPPRLHYDGVGSVARPPSSPAGAGRLPSTRQSSPFSFLVPPPLPLLSPSPTSSPYRAPAAIQPAAGLAKGSVPSHLAALTHSINALSPSPTRRTRSPPRAAKQLAAGGGKSRVPSRLAALARDP